MENNIHANTMHSADMAYLTESAMIESANEQLLNEAVCQVKTDLEGTSDASDIIEFRNAYPNGKLADPSAFVAEGMQRFAAPFIKKSVTLKEAEDMLFRMNKALNSDYMIEDIVRDPRREAKDGSTVISFSTPISARFKELESRLTYMAEACHDCMYDDLFDADTLKEYLPVLYLFA